LQEYDTERQLWEFELPIWKRLPAFCSDPGVLRFNGSALYGGFSSFSMRMSSLLPTVLQSSQPEILVTLASSDGSLPEFYGYLDRCAVVMRWLCAEQCWQPVYTVRE
jgi:hypothetical protein